MCASSNLEKNAELFAILGFYSLSAKETLVVQRGLGSYEQRVARGSPSNLLTRLDASSSKVPGMCFVL